MTPIDGRRDRPARRRTVSRACWRRSTRRCGGCARELPAETTLIGFCGAPWTVATYMIAGHGTPDQAPARLFAYRHPEAFARLLIAACRSFGALSHPPDRGRRRCGADFRFLGGRARRGVVRSASASSRSREIVSQVRAAYPDVPIIGFPKGAGARYDRLSRSETGVTALGLDWTVPLAQAARLQADGCRAGQSRSAAAGRRRQGAGDGVDAISARRWAMARWSSISATASRRRRRSTHVEAMIARVRKEPAHDERRHRSEQRARRCGAWARDRAIALSCVVLAALLFLARPRQLLSLGQGGPRDRGDLLDGGHALSAAAVRLSRRVPSRLGAVGDLQGHGAPAAARHHQSGDDRRPGCSGCGLPGRAFGFHGRLAARQDRAGRG